MSVCPNVSIKWQKYDMYIDNEANFNILIRNNNLVNHMALYLKYTLSKVIKLDCLYYVHVHWFSQSPDIMLTVLNNLVNSMILALLCTPIVSITWHKVDQ